MSETSEEREAICAMVEAYDDPNTPKRWIGPSARDDLLLEVQSYLRTIGVEMPEDLMVAIMDGKPSWGSHALGIRVRITSARTEKLDSP